MRTYRPDTAARARSTAGVAVSTALVGVPLSGLVAAATLVRHLLASGVATTDPVVALLALAATALVAVLGWATAAAAAGVRQGWQHAVGGRGRMTTSRVPSHRRGDLLAAAVATLVVATLTAPAASAGTQPAPVAASTETVQERQPAQDQPAAGRDAAVRDAAERDAVERDAVERPTGIPGSWSALADGFRAPAGASPGATGLVTGRPSRPVDAPREVVVVAGDSLWAIAARHLGPEADDAQVAEAWPAWWLTNRSTIGEDPDLLLPGQRLTVPAG